VAGRRRGELSAREVRWAALAAQGLDRPRPARRPGRAALLDTVRRLGVLQLDAINVVERTQFLVPFSRLGAYDVADLRGLWGPCGELLEYWAHAASVVPMAHQPLLRWRMAEHGPYGASPTHAARMAAADAALGDYVGAVLAEVREKGPLTAGQLSDPRRTTGGEWWGRRSDGRRVLERLFARGEVAGWRNAAFERVYDVPERVVPAEILAVPTPPVEDAHRALLMVAAGALGVATARDLADYHHLPVGRARPRIAELVEDGQLEPVTVEGWGEPAYLAPGARIARPTRREATVLSPFDSLVWSRDRLARVFGFDYRIEVYVPAGARRHGYYVLPVLLGDTLVARVDLKTDRAASVLRVRAAHAEPGVDRTAVAGALAAELGRLGAWSGAADVVVEGPGDLAGPLAGALASAG
jgi:hypothetical protein